jgi:hypothetical protein
MPTGLRVGTRCGTSFASGRVFAKESGHQQHAQNCAEALPVMPNAERTLSEPEDAEHKHSGLRVVMV